MPVESIVTSKIAASHAVTLLRREMPPCVDLFRVIRSPLPLLQLFFISIIISQ